MNAPRLLFIDRVFFNRFHLGLLIALAAVLPATAAMSIRSAGILGNSGESGDTLVRFSGRGGPVLNTQGGLGFDRAGYLWAFAGPSAINRYARDGRMLGTYPLSAAMQSRGRQAQTLTLAGDNLIILSNDKLWSLSINAPAGTAPEALPVAARAMALTAIDGRIALIGPAGELSVWNSVTRLTEPRGAIPETVDGEKTRGQSIALLPDNSLIIDSKLKLTPEGGLQKIKLPGAQAQWLGGSLYVYTWNMTIHRVTADGAPTPGVVYGGKSGAFIGTLHQDGELHQPSGLVHLGGDRYAATAGTGVIHLLRWDAEKRLFVAVRRIGAVYRESGLGLDRQGRVWWNNGYWNWTDGPADLPRNTTYPTDGDGWQMAFLASDAMTGLTQRHGKAALYYGPVDYNRDRLDPDAAKQTFPKNLTGAAVFGEAGNEEVLVVAADGKGVILSVDTLGRLRRQRGPVALTLTNDKPAITSLGRTPSGELLAADGNAIIRLKREGDTFTETARLPGWGGAADENFGPGLYLAADGERLWVSDPANQRVLLFTLADGGELRAPAIFTGDAAIGSLNRPRRITARGDRAVVVDWDNQRLVKLELTSVPAN